VLVGGVDEDLRAALELAFGGFLYQHQRRAVVGMLEDRLGVPGDVLGAVAQEVVVAQLGPQLLGGVAVDLAAAAQQVEGGVLVFADALLAVDRVLQAAAQGALGLGVQLA